MTTPRDPNTPRNPDQLINAFLDEGPMDLREQVLDEVRSEVDRTEQRTTFGPWRNLMATRFAGFAAATAVVAGAVIVGLALSGGGPPPGTDPNPSADLGIFAPLAGRIVYEGPDGIAGVDPAAPADPASTVQLTSGAGLPLGWSADGSRLLLFREEQLFVLHADGSETRLTEPLSVFQGATMSPDGSRVVFANGTETPEGEWVDFALYAVAIDGGSARWVWFWAWCSPVRWRRAARMGARPRELGPHRVTRARRPAAVSPPPLGRGRPAPPGPT